MCKISVVGSRYVNTKKVLWVGRNRVLCDVYSNGLVVPRDPDQIPPHVSLQAGNDKVGHGAQMFNMPIFETCRRDAPCFAIQTGEDTGKRGPCYACGGLFTMYGNVIIPCWGNWNALRTMSEEDFYQAIKALIKPSTKVFRWMEQGDFVGKLVRVAVRLAIEFPEVEFYGYTKKYSLWNAYVREHGNSLGKAIPSNLTIRFSEWAGLPMDNPYGFPVSGFVPAGEDIPFEDGDVVCPCSNPEWAGTCIECHQCIDCKATVYLKEHSTSLSARWDSISHDGQKVVKLSEKSGKKELTDKDRKALENARKRLEKKGIDPDTLKPCHRVNPYFDAEEWTLAHSF